MSNYSDPITATGSLISFDTPAGGIFDSLSVPITPTQDLHGYDHPWPGGGWKNVMPNVGNSTTFQNVTLTYNFGDSTYTLNGSTTSPGNIPLASISPTLMNWVVGNGYTLSCRVVSGSFTLGEGTGITYAVAMFNSSYSSFIRGGTRSTEAELDGYTGTGNAFSSTGNYQLMIQCWRVGTVFDNLKIRIQIEAGSSATAWTPYANICPISGIDNLSVYVSPNTQQAQATEYAVSFGSTVYAGFADPITGEVKERPQYPSYNGEVLVGPWLSSMDEYAVGVTPTTGAQVVDLGGALATESITPVDISMREGLNNIWVDTSAVITIIYRLLQIDRQTGATSIGRLAQNLLIANQFGAYSKVILNVTEELYYEAGNETGRTLELTCPFGTQAMANNILAMLEGFQYQPYTAERAILDPAAELGDGLTVNGVYGGIFRLSIKSGAVYNADVSAPADEEIDHEYAFIPNAERKIERRINNLSSELSVQAGEIAAKVDREGGDPSSVSWTMDADVFKVAVDGSDVLTVDENGLTVNGNGSFTGEVQAKNIKYGGSNGTFSGGGISGGSIGTSKFTSGINISLGNADFSADVFSGAATASWTKANNILVRAGGMLNVVGSAKIKYGNSYAGWKSTVVKDSSGNNITIHYLGF